MAESESDVVAGIKMALDNQLKTAFHGSGMARSIDQAVHRTGRQCVCLLQAVLCCAMQDISKQASPCTLEESQLMSAI